MDLPPPLWYTNREDSHIPLRNAECIAAERPYAAERQKHGDVNAPHMKTRCSAASYAARNAGDADSRRRTARVFPIKGAPRNGIQTVSGVLCCIVFCFLGQRRGPRCGRKSSKTSASSVSKYASSQSRRVTSQSQRSATCSSHVVKARISSGKCHSCSVIGQIS